MTKNLQREITHYGDISVAFNQQKVQHDKQTAFQNRVDELNNKLAMLNQDVIFKMKQFFDLAVKRKQTLSSHRESFAAGRGMSSNDQADGQQLEHQQLDVEELKIQGEIDFTEQII